MKMTRFGLIAAVAFAGTAGAAAARDTVQIAGSSTVLPYARIVAENFKEEFPEYKTVVESGGSSGGLKRFCEGVGTEFIDIANSSRSIRDKEITACADKGVTEIIEIKIGYDGIVFAYDVNADAMNFEPIDIYRALAKEIVVDGAAVANPNKTLADVDGRFPAWGIDFHVPASNHGTREVFEVKMLEAGCEAAGDFEVFKAAAMAAGEDESAAKKTAEKRCIALRTDGVTEVAGDYTETIAGVDNNKEAIGVFGLAFYENNKDKLRVATVSDIDPTAASIADGTYPVSRPLFFYVKKAHLAVIPGMKEYVEFFISEEMTGPGSPTVAYGLVAAPDSERDSTRATFTEMSQ